MVVSESELMFFFFFQAEDGIRDVAVTGVQTCALPISAQQGCQGRGPDQARCADGMGDSSGIGAGLGAGEPAAALPERRRKRRSEERRVGKECRSRWSPYH